MQMIQENLSSKWDEITAVKKEREALFTNFDENKDRISELYYEIEIKKLQYMFLKREQLSVLKIISKVPDDVAKIEYVNETCIGIIQKNLVDEGYEERLKSEGLI